MFKPNLVTYPNASNRHGFSYGENVGRAARAFLAALLAVEPPRQKAAARNVPVSEHVRIKGVEDLLSLARQFDSTMPNQAAELRYLAASDPTN